jgi:hypothetical protein
MDIGLPPRLHNQDPIFKPDQPFLTLLRKQYTTVATILLKLEHSGLPQEIPLINHRSFLEADGIGVDVIAEAVGDLVEFVFAGALSQKRIADRLGEDFGHLVDLQGVGVGLGRQELEPGVDEGGGLCGF